ncbi:MAG: hypothetical protein ACLGIF_00645, partial [Actinomycetes bacterium]
DRDAHRHRPGARAAAHRRRGAAAPIPAGGVLLGAAVECRINAEDPARGYVPTPGLLETYDLPAGPFTRMDTGYRAGDRVSPHYDSLLGKLVVWAPTRAEALARMDRALAELTVRGPGVHTTTALHRALLRHPDVRADRHDVQFLDRELPRLLEAADAIARDPAAVAPLVTRPDSIDSIDHAVPAGPRPSPDHGVPVHPEPVHAGPTPKEG